MADTQPKSLMEFIGSQPGLEEPRWLKAYCERLEQLELPDRRTVVHIPPQHGTTLTTLHGLVWLMERNPFATIGYATYSWEQARELSHQLSDIAGRCNFNVKVQYRSQGRTGVRIVRGNSDASVWFTAVGQGTLGFAFDILVLDSPYKTYTFEKDAEDERDRTYEWLKTSWVTRAKPHASMIVVGPRQATYDVFGRLLNLGLANERWHYCNLKAIATEPCPARGPDPNRREVGEPLWHKRQAMYDDLAKNPTWFKALCQGEPESTAFTDMVIRPKLREKVYQGEPEA